MMHSNAVQEWQIQVFVPSPYTGGWMPVTEPCSYMTTSPLAAACTALAERGWRPGRGQRVGAFSAAGDVIWIATDELLRAVRDPEYVTRVLEAVRVSGYMLAQPEPAKARAHSPVTMHTVSPLATELPLRAVTGVERPKMPTRGRERGRGRGHERKRRSWKNLDNWRGLLGIWLFVWIVIIVGMIVFGLLIRGGVVVVVGAHPSVAHLSVPGTGFVAPGGRGAVVSNTNTLVTASNDAGVVHMFVIPAGDVGHTFVLTQPTETHGGGIELLSADVDRDGYLDLVLRVDASPAGEWVYLLDTGLQQYRVPTASEQKRLYLP